MWQFIQYSVANVFRRKTIAILAIIGTMLGASLMTVLLSLSNGMEQRLNSTLDKVAGDVTVSAQGGSILTSFLGGGETLPVSYMDQIKQLKDVKFVEGTVSTNIPKISLPTLNPIGTPLQGISIDQDQQFSGPVSNISEGRMFQTTDEVIVGETLKDQAKLSGNPIALGQKIIVSINTSSAVPIASSSANPLLGRAQIATPSAKTVKTKTLTVVGFFNTGNDINDRNVVGDISLVRELTGISNDQVGSIKVRAESSDTVEQVSNEINDTFKNTDHPVSTSVAKDLLGDINKTLDIFRSFLLVISGVSAVAGGMSIFIIMLMSVTERMQEFGILKAAGWSNGNLLTAVLIESISLALIGALIGFLVGFGVGQVIDYKLGETIAIITPQLIGGVVGFGVIMGVLGGIYPAIRAARVSPIETLKSL